MNDNVYLFKLLLNFANNFILDESQKYQ